MKVEIDNRDWWGWKYERDPCECPCCCPGRGTVVYDFTWSGHHPDHEEGETGRAVICWFCYFKGCLPDRADGTKFWETPEVISLNEMGVPFRPWDLDGVCSYLEDMNGSWTESIPFNRKIASPVSDFKELNDHPDSVLSRDLDFEHWNPFSLLGGLQRDVMIGSCYPVIIGPGSRRCYSVIDQYWNRTLIKWNRQSRQRRGGEWGFDDQGLPLEDSGEWGRINMNSDVTRMGLHGILEAPGLNDNYPRYLK